MAGTEPSSARSMTRTRIGLAVFGLVICVLGCLWLLSASSDQPAGTATFLVVVAGFCAAGALIAIMDLAVLVRRSRREGTQHRSGPRP